MKKIDPSNTHKSHTFKIVQVSSFVPLQKKLFSVQFIYIQFRPILQVHVYNSFISFYYNVYPSHVLFFKVLFSNFTEKIFVQFFVTVLLYRKFSYFVQFYSFKLAIFLHHFLTVCSSVTRSKFQVSSFVFLQEIFSVQGFFTFFYIFYIYFRPFLQFHLYNSFIS